MSIPHTKLQALQNINAFAKVLKHLKPVAILSAGLPQDTQMTLKYLDIAKLQLRFNFIKILHYRFPVEICNAMSSSYTVREQCASLISRLF